MPRCYDTSDIEANRTLIEACAILVTFAISNNGGKLIVYKGTDAPNARGPGGISRAQLDAALELLSDEDRIYLIPLHVDSAYGATLGMEAHFIENAIKASRKRKG